MPILTGNLYIAWITPVRGDPTHSLLRAHLLFEQLLDEHLAKSLPHAGALADARFTFAQKLAISRAVAKYMRPNHWVWQALSRLNKIRNSLAHSPGPRLTTDLAGYVDFYIKHSGNRLPDPSGSDTGGNAKIVHEGEPAYTAADMVTMGLYLNLAHHLGFDTEPFGS